MFVQQRHQQMQRAHHRRGRYGVLLPESGGLQRGRCGVCRAIWTDARSVPPTHAAPGSHTEPQPQRELLRGRLRSVGGLARVLRGHVHVRRRRHVPAVQAGYWQVAVLKGGNQRCLQTYHHSIVI
jgi:hypothetical protein